MPRITIDFGEGNKREFACSESALELVRYSFNPSGSWEAASCKALAAAFISQCEQLRDDDPVGYDPRAAAIAITNAETASMYAVKSATKSR